MKIFENIDEWILCRNQLIADQVKIGFVPTMGALHQGHLSLVTRAKKDNLFVVVSIFVNPTQFNNPSDLEKYPRTIESDIDMLKKAGADAVIVPSGAEIYHDNYELQITENNISKILCGAHRPGHFTGVLTVVMKLLGIVQPQFCYMGEKDYQQYLLIDKLARAFFVNTKIIPCATQREVTGLAMSSRNSRLSTSARDKAAIIYQLLKSKKTCPDIQAELVRNGFQVDYVEEHWGRRFIAAQIENVRLIDNEKI